jgi:hypothetical protein
VPKEGEEEGLGGLGKDDDDDGSDQITYWSDVLKSIKMCR